MSDRKLCAVCKRQIPESRPTNAKTCGEKCSREAKAQKMREYNVIRRGGQRKPRGESIDVSKPCSDHLAAIGQIPVGVIMGLCNKYGAAVVARKMKEMGLTGGLIEAQTHRKRTREYAVGILNG